MRTLYEAVEPRTSVYDFSRNDTVWNLSDLEKIDAAEFFSENYITEAMRTLLPEAFKRLEQKSDSTSGVFHLSQSMGGGKTHSLIALGLLADHPQLRESVLTECGYTPGSMGRVRVIAFDGVAETTPNGLWGAIAEKIGRPEVLKNCYTPLRAPAGSEWIELLAGEPTLILLDELPRYFNAIRAIETGSTTLDQVTVSALASLLQAIHANKLPNVCLVITDLAGTAYQGSAVALASLSDAEKEANRVAIRLSPVNLNTDELYQILRKRLFQKLPSEDDIADVANGFMSALETARNMGLVADVRGSFRTNIIDAYPFHPSIRDLYARVKENDTFQQTRALIRIARNMVRRMWKSGQAKEKYLIGAQDFDLLDQSMKSELAQINATFEPAIAKDIQSSSGDATAQTIDKGQSDAQDAAKLLLLSSMSTAVNPVHGLHRTEIAEYLAAPDRDLTRLRESLDELQDRANFLHPLPGSKLVFRNTENLVAKVEEYVRNTTTDMREQEVRKRLVELFKPTAKDVYDEVMAMVSLDQVVLESDKVKLLIYRPTAESKAAVEEFFAQQNYKNRVLFLTSEGEPYQTALERAAYLAAIERVMGEPTFTALNSNDPQRKQALELQGSYQSRFFQALSTGFSKLSYPWTKGLYEVEIEGSVEIQNGEQVVTRGEASIKRKLIEMGKFVEEQTPEKLLPKLERIWPESQKTIEWSELKRLAATTTGYAWHHPKALEYLRDEMIKRGEWRPSGDSWIERGPFAKPDARVEVDILSQDKETGRCAIRVRPIPNSAVVYHSTERDADETCERLTEFEFESADMWHSFLAVDPKGEYPKGQAIIKKFAPLLKYAFPMIDGKKHVSFTALPACEVMYTDDGSSVETSGRKYTSPFAPTPGSLVQAIAKGNGESSQRVEFQMPSDEAGPVIDQKKPAVWTPSLEFSADSTQETYRLLELIKKYSGKLGKFVRLVASKSGKTTDLTATGGTFHPEEFIQSIDVLRTFVQDPNITLNIEELHFDSGRDLEDFAKELPLEIGDDEVRQHG